MNLVNTRLPRLFASILTVVASVVGLVLIGVLPVLNIAEGPATLGYYISQVTYLMKNMGSIDPSAIPLFVSSIVNVVVYLVTYITAIVFLIKCIISLARFKTEASSKRIVFDSLKLSFVLLTFFGLSIFFNYGFTASIAVGGYLALALGGAGTLFVLCNYFMASQRETLNKCLRICFVLVALTASIFALMPTITISNSPAAPGLFLFSTIQSMISGGAVDTLMLSVAVLKFAFFVIAYSFASSVATTAVDERKKNDGRSVATIVLSAIALALVLGALFGVRLAIDSNSIGVSLFGIMSIVLMTLTLGLAILVFVITKKETVKVTPIEFTHSEDEVEEEPAEEPVEESAEEVSEEPKEEAPVEEEKVEKTPVVVPIVEVEEVSEPVEEPAKEEDPKAKKSEEKKEKPAPKKKAAPAKKAEEKKEEDKEAKKNASYHISKRASDNKWQVFRAGSEKVIKLFDTKVEAEEYTKRMAENQGVGYLSHASKGKNKGRIQKK